MNHGLHHSQNRTHTTSPYDTNYGDKEVSSHSELKELTSLRLENEVLMEMLKEQIATNNGWQPLRVGLLKRPHVSFTREEIVPDVNESTSQDKGKRKVAKVPKFEYARDRQAYEAPK